MAFFNLILPFSDDDRDRFGTVSYCLSLLGWFGRRSEITVLEPVYRCCVYRCLVGLAADQKSWCPNHQRQWVASTGAFQN